MKESHLHALELQLSQAWPPRNWEGTRILMAVSGGADSIALLTALHHLARRPELLHVGHFNHHWRGPESDADADFVAKTCRDLGIDCKIGHAATGGDFPRTEESARKQRYAFLTRLAYQVGARYVVTAHTADDRIETMLHNLCRGTGLAGMCTPESRSELDAELILVRPMLSISREQVLSYLGYRQQAFRLDASNADTAFTRNYIRHRIWPLLRERFGPSLDQHWLDFSDIVGQSRQAIAHYAQQLIHEYAAVGDRNEKGRSSSLRMSVQKLRAVPWPVTQAALELEWRRLGWPLKDMSRRHWEQIRLAVYESSSRNASGEKLNLPADIQLWIQSDWVWFEEMAAHKD